jgi:hypothetical protein
MTKLAAKILFALSIAATTGADAAELPPPIPENVASEAFKLAPAPWREYLLQARSAERIVDPLKRCLAFPDLPGNRWPAGHSQAVCRYRYASVISMAELEAYLDNGDIEGLDAKIEAYLDMHFSKEDFSEDIHVFYRQFKSASAETDRVSARWLSLAPKSAFALMGRGMYLEELAWDARGAKWASETSQQKMRKKTEIVDQAVPLLRAALKREPKLMPAYSSLMNLGVLDSRDDLVEDAISLGEKQDRDCFDLVYRRMFSMKPRWGGAYEDMLAYANALLKRAQERPLLAIAMALPYGDRGGILTGQEKYNAETAEVLTLAVAIGADQDAFYDAADTALNRKDAKADQWKALALLLQEVRYRPTNAWGNRTLARSLVEQEPEWSLKYGLSSIDLDEKSSDGQYFVATAYKFLKRFDDAERHYRLSLQDNKYMQETLREIAAMWLYDSGLKNVERAVKAKPYIDRMISEYPDDAIGWLMRVDYEAAEKGAASIDTLRDFLRHADRSNPEQLKRYDQIVLELSKKGIKYAP